MTFEEAWLVVSKRMAPHPREVMGAHCYMAPEDAPDEHTKLRTVAGLCGLPAILYELLTGYPPFGEGKRSENIRLPLIQNRSDCPCGPGVTSGRIVRIKRTEARELLQK
jgi:hypothetical protein